MESLSHYFLTALIFLPGIGAAVMLVLKRRRLTRWIALGFTVATFAMSLSLLATYDWHSPRGNAPATYDCRDPSHPRGVVQFVQKLDLVPALRLQYFVGIDGLSLPLVLLTGFIAVRVCVATWHGAGGLPIYPPAQGPPPSPMLGAFPDKQLAILLCLETTLLGTFLSLNFAQFVFFFAMSAIPIAMLLRKSVVRQRRFAALQFLTGTLFSILLLIIVMIEIYRHAGSFDLVALPAILHGKYAAGTPLFRAGRTLFWLLMAGFLFRLPIFPLHRWLWRAYVEAPMPLGMMVCAGFVATAGYGMLRIAYPVFPDAARLLWLVIAGAGIVNILFGALAAMAQQSFRRLVACVSTSQTGLFLLGIAMLTPASLNGATFMLAAQGMTGAMLLALAGILFDRLGHDDFSRAGGLGQAMPVFTGFAAFAFLAASGLPVLCGFVAEILVLIGAFGAGNGGAIIRAGGWAGASAVYGVTILACLGTLLLPAAMLWKFQQFFRGAARR